VQITSPTNYRPSGNNLEEAASSIYLTSPAKFAASKSGLMPTPATALVALGIVYGDLRTSPLYTLQAVIGASGGHFSRAMALGSLSLIFWALIITISVKYCLFVMRADARFTTRTAS
jgi:K+ transporter